MISSVCAPDDIQHGLRLMKCKWLEVDPLGQEHCIIHPLIFWQLISISVSITQSEHNTSDHNNVYESGIMGCLGSTQLYSLYASVCVCVYACVRAGDRCGRSDRCTCVE